MFVNENSDYHLQAGSPAIDAGISVSEVLKDYYGNARPQNNIFDIGIHEFSAAPITTQKPARPRNLRVW